MFLKLSTWTIFLLSLTMAVSAKASRPRFLSPGESLVLHTCDSNPAPKIKQPNSYDHGQTADFFEPLAWLKKNRSTLDSGYASYLMCNTCVLKFPLSNGAVITLNKNSVSALNVHSGILIALSGEAYLETKYHRSMVFVDDTTVIGVNPHSKLNIQSYVSQNFTISLVKGSYEIFHNSIRKSFNTIGRQVSFNHLGNLGSDIACDTSQVIRWTKKAKLQLE